MSKNADHFLTLLKSGDPAACKTLVESYYVVLYRQHWALSGDRDFAEDLTQETFVEVWKSLKSFRGDSSLKTWIHTIALRVWQQKIKSRGRFDVGIEDIEIERLPSGSRRAFEYVVADTDALRQALASLPLSYREAIVLFYMEGFSYQEIAAAQRVPLGTVKSRLNDAIKRLRLQMQPAEEAGGIR